MRRWILERYVLSEVLKTFLFALAVFTFLFLLGSVFAFVRDRLSFGQILKVIPFALPYMLTYNMPIALLVATALCYGRLTADNEVMALRTSGVHLFAITIPALLLGTAVTLGALYLQASIIPYCHFKKSDILKAIIEEFLSLRKGNNVRFNFPNGVELFCSRFESPYMEGLVIRTTQRRKEGGKEVVVPVVVVANQGRFFTDKEEKNIYVELRQVSVTYDETGGSGKAFRRGLVGSLTIPLTPLIKKRRMKPKYGDIWVLRRAIRDLEETLRQVKITGPRPRFKLEKDLAELRAEYHYRFSMSFSCLTFVLIGVSLPILLNQNSRLVPFFAGFMVVSVLFYIPFLAGKQLAESGKLAAWLGLWLGDGLTLLAGVGFLWSAYRK
jgi:lipopolysaccharide export LptBFGC system permease protein LptF